MTRTISDATVNALEALIIKGSVAAFLIKIAVERGFELTEIAAMSGISRTALHNWINGAIARKKNLIQLINKLNIDESYLDSRIQSPKVNERNFDSKSLIELASYEALKINLLDLIVLSKKSNQESNHSIFVNKLYKNHGKSLIEASLNMPSGGRLGYQRDYEIREGYGAKLVLVFLNSIDSWEGIGKRSLMSLQKILIYILSFDQYQTEDLEVISTDEFEIIENINFLPILLIEIKEFHHVYDKVNALVKELLPDAVLALDSDIPDAKNSVPICDLWWESTCTSEDIICSFEQNGCGDAEGELLLTWLNDVDGRFFMNSVRDKIKNSMLTHKTELEIFAYQGRFFDLNDFDDLNSSEKKHLKNIFESVLEVSIVERQYAKLKKFQLGDDEQLEKATNLYDFGPSKLFVEGCEFPFTHKALEFLFTSLGFTVKFYFNKPTKWIHKIKINW
jgi:hypothetical protein